MARKGPVLAAASMGELDLELDKMTDKPLNAWSLDSLTRMADLLVKKIQCTDGCDAQSVYVLSRRLLHVLHVIAKRHDESFTRIRFGPVLVTIQPKYAGARRSLKRRYAERGLDQDATDEDNDDMELDTDDEPPRRKELTAVDIVLGAESDEKFVTAKQLHDLLKKSLKVLLIDTRPRALFQKSRIQDITTVNLDPDQIIRGLSMNTLCLRLPDTEQKILGTRFNFDLVVIMDFEFNQRIRDANVSKSEVLHTIMVKWDVHLDQYKHLPRILIGGYRDWVAKYPMLCLNPEGAVNDLQQDDTFMRFDYPTLELDFNSRNVMLVDRSNKPVYKPQSAPIVPNVEAAGEKVCEDVSKPDDFEHDQAGDPESDLEKVGVAVPCPVSLLKPSSPPGPPPRPFMYEPPPYEQDISRRENFDAHPQWMNLLNDPKQIFAPSILPPKYFTSKEPTVRPLRTSDLNAIFEESRVSKDVIFAELNRLLIAVSRRIKDEYLALKKLLEFVIDYNAMQSLVDRNGKIASLIVHVRKLESSENKWKDAELEYQAYMNKHLDIVKKYRECCSSQHDLDSLGAVYSMLHNAEIETLSGCAWVVNQISQQNVARGMQLDYSKAKSSVVVPPTLNGAPRDTAAASIGDVKSADSIKPTLPNREAKPIYLPGNKQQLGLSGLSNQYNNCYMNALLQCLRHVPCLYEYMLTERFFRSKKANCHTKWLTLMYHVFRQLWSTASAPSITNCYDLYSYALEHISHFQRDQHEDGMELFTLLFQYLSEEVMHDVSLAGQRQLTSAPYIEYWWTTHGGRSSFFVRHFYSLVMRRQICALCGNQVMSFEMGNTIMLPMVGSDNSRIKMATNLQEAVNQFALEKPESMTCSKCRVPSYGDKSVRYYPDVLVINMKRFAVKKSLKGYVRCDNPINFPEKDLRFGDQKYRLVSVLLHSGTRDSGHYTAACLNPINNTWYKYDDGTCSVLRDVANDVEIKLKAYAFFYCLQGNFLSLNREFVKEREK